MVIFTSLHFVRCIPAVPVTNPLFWRLLFFLSMEETRMSADSMLAQLQGRIAPMQSMTRLWAAYAKDDVARCHRWYTNPSICWGGMPLRDLLPEPQHFQSTTGSSNKRDGIVH
jgi:hypothetical protein